MTHAILRVTESFIEDTGRIYSPRVNERIRQCLNMIEHNPDIGSPLARPYLTERYGADIRTVAISTFVLVYRHNGDFVDVLALVYGPTIR
jgi:hypothetical protein